MELDVARLRASFPALDQGVAYFDGPGGTQVPREVAQAIADTLTSGISNRGCRSPPPSAARTRSSLVPGRRSRTCSGVRREGAGFARSTTEMTYGTLDALLAKRWGPGDEVVVTRLDHDANIRPWVQAAEAAGAGVRWVGFDKEIRRPRRGRGARTALRPDPAGRRHRRLQRAGHPTRHPGDRRCRARGRCPRLRRRRRAPHTGTAAGRRRGALGAELLRLLALQVPRPAPRRARCLPCGPRGHPPRQAAALEQRRP